jgi:hypothetical protein
MRTEKQKNMTRITRKLNKVIDLHCSACGHDELVREAIDREMKLLKFIESLLPEGKP